MGPAGPSLVACNALRTIPSGFTSPPTGVTFGAMPREPLPAPPTLAQLGRHQCWLWVSCTRWGCPHRAPMALAPVIIRWGPDASSDVLR